MTVSQIQLSHLCQILIIKKEKSTNIWGPKPLVCVLAPSLTCDGDTGSGDTTEPQSPRADMLIRLSPVSSQANMSPEKKRHVTTSEQRNTNVFVHQRERGQ